MANVKALCGAVVLLLSPAAANAESVESVRPSQTKAEVANPTNKIVTPAKGKAKAGKRKNGQFAQEAAPVVGAARAGVGGTVGGVGGTVGGGGGGGGFLGGGLGGLVGVTVASGVGAVIGNEINSGAPASP